MDNKVFNYVRLTQWRQSTIGDSTLHIDEVEFFDQLFRFHRLKTLNSLNHCSFSKVSLDSKNLNRMASAAALPKDTSLVSIVALAGLPQSQNQGSSTTTNAKPKKKICCACPDTKKLRDECIVQHGEDACSKWIEAHKLCLRAEGFNV